MPSLFTQIKKNKTYSPANLFPYVYLVPLHKLELFLCVKRIKSIEALQNTHK